MVYGEAHDGPPENVVASGGYEHHRRGIQPGKADLNKEATKRVPNQDWRSFKLRGRSNKIVCVFRKRATAQTARPLQSVSVFSKVHGSRVKSSVPKERYEKFLPAPAAMPHAMNKKDRWKLATIPSASAQVRVFRVVIHTSLSEVGAAAPCCACPSTHKPLGLRRME